MDTFLIIMVMLILGGLGRFPGAVLGAFGVTFLDYYLRPLENYRLVVFGFIVLVAVVFVPKGIMGLPDSARPYIKRAFTRLTRRGA